MFKLLLRAVVITLGLIGPISSDWGKSPDGGSWAFVGRHAINPAYALSTLNFSIQTMRHQDKTAVYGLQVPEYTP